MFRLFNLTDIQRNSGCTAAVVIKTVVLYGRRFWYFLLPNHSVCNGFVANGLRNCLSCYYSNHVALRIYKLDTETDVNPDLGLHTPELRILLMLRGHLA